MHDLIINRSRQQVTIGQSDQYNNAWLHILQFLFLNRVWDLEDDLITLDLDNPFQYVQTGLTPHEIEHLVLVTFSNGQLHYDNQYGQSLLDQLGFVKYTDSVTGEIEFARSEISTPFAMQRSPELAAQRSPTITTSPILSNLSPLFPPYV